MEEGWTPGWRRWFAEGANRHDALEARTLWIRDRVRAAVRELAGPERIVIEAIYYDGLSLDQIGMQTHLSKNRVVVTHRRALAELRIALTPLVAEVFGLGMTTVPSCPICIADWRGDAESMLDGMTAEMTWGAMIVRLERAFGWRAKSPRVLIVHQRHHRLFQSQTLCNKVAELEIRPSPQPSPLKGEGAELATTNVQQEVEENDGETAWSAFDQTVCLDRNEDAFGRVGDEA